MALAPIAALTHAAARAEAAALKKNLARRAARLEARGLQTNAVAEFRALQAAGAPETRNQAVSQVAALRRLDKAAGTRSRTAEAVYSREARRAARDRLAESTRSSPALSGMSTQDLRDSAKVRLERIRGARRRVYDEIGRDAQGNQRQTHATLRLNELLDSLPSEPTRQQTMSTLAQLNRIESYEGITPQGARRQADRGREYFGDDYDRWTDAERGYVWDEVHRMTQSGQAVGSGAALELVSGYVKNDKISVSFRYNSVDSQGNVTKLSKPVVGFGIDYGAAEVDSMKKEQSRRMIRQMRENAAAGRKPIRFKGSPNRNPR